MGHLSISCVPGCGSSSERRCPQDITAARPKKQRSRRSDGMNLSERLTRIAQGRMLGRAEGQSGAGGWALRMGPEDQFCINNSSELQFLHLKNGHKASLPPGLSENPMSPVRVTHSCPDLLCGGPRRRALHRHRLHPACTLPRPKTLQGSLVVSQPHQPHSCSLI